MNVIGLDIGGTKITGIVFDGKKVLKSETVLTPKDLTAFKAAILQLAEKLSVNYKIHGIGIGMAGIVNQKQLTVVSSPNLKFIENFNFKKLFPKIKIIKLDNDANCFARAESKLGQGRGLKSFIGLTLGTGVGGGLVSMGQVYLGETGSAGEAGHMMLDFDHSLEHYFQLARDASDYEQMAKVLGILLANIYNLLDLQAVILGGSVAINSHNKFLPQAVQFAQTKLLNKQIKIQVKVSKLKDAGAIGAALLVK